MRSSSGAPGLDTRSTSVLSLGTAVNARETAYEGEVGCKPPELDFTFAMARFSPAAIFQDTHILGTRPLVSTFAGALATVTPQSTRTNSLNVKPVRPSVDNRV